MFFEGFGRYFFSRIEDLGAQAVAGHGALKHAPLVLPPESCGGGPHRQCAHQARRATGQVGAVRGPVFGVSRRVFGQACGSDECEIVSRRSRPGVHVPFLSVLVRLWLIGRDFPSLLSRCHGWAQAHVALEVRAADGSCRPCSDKAGPQPRGRHRTEVLPWI